MRSKVTSRQKVLRTGVMKPQHTALLSLWVELFLFFGSHQNSPMPKEIYFLVLTLIFPNSGSNGYQKILVNLFSYYRSLYNNARFSLG